MPSECSEGLEGKAVAKTLAQYIVELSFDKLPSSVIEKTKVCILDSLGCAIGGASTDIGLTTLNLIRHVCGGGDSTVIGLDRKTSCLQASFANSTLTNALDFDDTYIGHPGATVIPSALAIAEEINASGRDFISAVVAGYEASIRIGRGVRPVAERKLVHGHSGWQTFGAAAAAGRLLKLNMVEMMNALGIAGANAPVQSVMKTVMNPAGVTMVKNNFGIATIAGVMAAHLARDGFIGPRNIFEGETGFWRMIGSDINNTQLMTEALGERYDILLVSLKPYPCCRLIHSAIDATISVTINHSIGNDDIERITVNTYSPAAKWFTKRKPKTMVEAQFSLPYCIATILNKVPLGPEWFTSKTLTDPAILSLAEKVVLLPDQEADLVIKRDPSRIVAKVEVVMRDGRKYENRVDLPLGDPLNPMLKERIIEKFMRLASGLLSKRDAARLIQLVESLEEVSDMNQLTDILVKASKS